MEQDHHRYLNKIPQFLKTTSPQMLLSEKKKQLKRTKSICTIGPQSKSPKIAGQLIKSGLNVARLNFSHGTHQSHLDMMNGILEAAQKIENSNVAILLDTKGPQIRTGQNLNGQLIELKKGQLLEITTDYNHKGTSSRIACSYEDLPQSTQIGKKILIADGGVSTKVLQIQKQLVTVEVLNDGKIGSRKNMCLPGCIINLPTITQKDRIDIVEFGLKHKVNYIAVSFARYKKDLDDLRKFITEKDPEHGPYVQLISKIENHEGVQNIKEIIEGSDGIMVARGDLGMEVPIQKVVLLQKYIMAEAINSGKIVITATQMIESMQSKPRPTRAQISDITNSVCDLADANMTSGQTANGLFPAESVAMLKDVAQQTEYLIEYKSILDHRKMLSEDKQAINVISYSFQMDCHLILIQTDSLRLISRLSCLRPKAYLIIFTDKVQVKRGVAVNFGVYCFDSCHMNRKDEFIRESRQYFGFQNTEQVKALQIRVENEALIDYKLIAFI